MGFTCGCVFGLLVCVCLFGIWIVCGVFAVVGGLCLLGGLVRVVCSGAVTFWLHVYGVWVVLCC